MDAWGVWRDSVSLSVCVACVEWCMVSLRVYLCLYVCMYVRPSPFELNSSISYPLCLSHPILPI